MITDKEIKKITVWWHANLVTIYWPKNIIRLFCQSCVWRSKTTLPQSFWKGFEPLKTLFNRPGVAGAVLQTPPSLIDSFIHSLSDPLWKYLQKIITPKPFELGTWNFDTMFTIPYVSCVTCHVLCVTCHVSRVTCKNWKCFRKVLELADCHPHCGMCHVSCVMYHVSCVMCHVSCVTCHMWKK